MHTLALILLDKAILIYKILLDMIVLMQFELNTKVDCPKLEHQKTQEWELEQ